MKAPACVLEPEGGGAGGALLRLSGALNFDSVPALHERAVALMFANRKSASASEEVTVDLSGVSDANSAGLALLLEWQRLALRDGRRLRIRNMPDSLRNLTRLCELDSLLPAEG